MKMPESKKGVLTPGEITKGMYVTVHHHIFEEEQGLFNNNESVSSLFGLISGKKSQDRTGMGMTLEVKAIQLPYVLVEQAIPSYVKMSTGRFIFDTRITVFMELNKDFINAYNNA